MKRLKKLFPALALCCLLVCLMPKAEAATTTGTMSDKIRWTYDDQTGVLSITGSGQTPDYYTTSPSTYVPWNSCGATSLVIGDGITDIGNALFAKNTTIRSVAFGKDVEMVGEHAFEGCTALETVHLNEGLETMKLCAFQDCSSLKEIKLPTTLTTIGSSAFKRCKSLTDINIPDGVKLINDDLFFGCTSLTTLVIPEGVTTIDEYVFRECSNLTAIVLPNSLTKIGAQSFDNSGSLAHVFYNGTEAEWDAINVMPQNGQLNNVSIHYYTKTSGTCGDNLTWEFDAKTFTLTISGSGDMYDYNDTYVKAQTPWYDIKSAIRKIVFSDEMTSIGAGAFENCELLHEVELPESIETIGDRAFAHSDRLVRISMKNNVTMLGKEAFVTCVALEDVTLSDNITMIGGYAFSRCSMLKTIVLPKNLMTLGECAFIYCEKLEEVVIPGGIQEIENSTFLDCSGLKTITLPVALKKIGFNAFDECSSLTDVYYHGMLNQWNSIEIDGSNEVLSYATLHTLCDDAEIITEYENHGNGTHTVTRTCSKCEDVLSTVKELCADENTDGLCDGCGEVYVFHAPNCYEVLALTIRDASGEELAAIPNSGFYAEVQLKKLLDADPVVAVLATYTSEDQLLNTYFMRADVPTGSSYSLGAWIGNADGGVGKVSVFLLSSLGNPLPVAEAKFVTK